MPVGIQQDAFEDLDSCDPMDLNDCIDNLTPGSQIGPGSFGWLSFGIQGNGGKCDWTNSLGMFDDGGCAVNQPFLDSQIGPVPEPNAHGCCSEVDLPGSEDKIGALTGNEWGDLSYYIENKVPVWVPIYSTFEGNGAKAYYNIVGFGAIVFGGQGDGTPHAKWLKGGSVGVTCNKSVPGHSFCAGPQGYYTIKANGAVQLVN